MKVSSLSDLSSPFTSLTLLDVGDDLSSMTGSSSIVSNVNYMSGLNNEVEILFYPAGTTLAKAGEMSTGTGLRFVTFRLFSSTIIGLFYVIEGFLDILLPVKEEGKGEPSAFRTSDADPWRCQSDSKQQKLLFTVKPGGIAGYLGKLLFRSKRFELLIRLQLHFATLYHTLTLEQRRTHMLDFFPCLLLSVSWKNDQ